MTMARPDDTPKDEWDYFQAQIHKFHSDQMLDNLIAHSKKSGVPIFVAEYENIIHQSFYDDMLLNGLKNLIQVNEFVENEGHLLAMRNGPDFLHEVGETIGLFFDHFLKNQNESGIFNWAKPAHIFRKDAKVKKHEKDEL